MKTIALFLLSGLLTSISLTGQSFQEFEIYNKPGKELFKPFVDNKLPYQDNEHSFIDRDVDDLWRQDSTIYFDIIEEVDSIAVKKGFITYDDPNKTVDYVTIEKLEHNSEWQYTGRNLITYNDQNLQVEIIRFDWNQDSNTWINSRKTEYEYNVNGYVKIQTSYIWHVDFEDWHGSAKHVYEYNDQELNYLRIFYLKNGIGPNDWAPFSKDSTSYNDDGLEIFKFNSQWNESTNLWDYYERISFSYENDIRSHYRDYWIDNEWKRFAKSDGYRIDSLTEMHNGYTYRDDSIWVHDYKVEVRFDQFGNLVAQESYRMPEGYNEWLGELKFEVFKNEEGLFLMSILYEWNYENKEWIYKSKRQGVYNEDLIRYYSCNYVWYHSENRWYKVTSSKSYFTNINSINESIFSNIAIQVHPNPSYNQITIDFENIDNSKAIYKIYTLSGEVVDIGIAQSKKPINVNKLDSGYYIIKLEVGDKLYSGKFLKL